MPFSQLTFIRGSTRIVSSPCGEVGVGWEEENLIMICLCWEGAVCNNPGKREGRFLMPAAGNILLLLKEGDNDDDNEGE